MMTEKRVLLLTPSFMNIYKDVMTCLEKKGWRVSWIKDNQVAKNPYIRDTHFWNRKPIKYYNKEVEALWKKILSEPQFSFSYDIFLAIDGLMTHPYLFETLRQRNPNVKKVLFLYDRVDGHFQTNSFFPYYDRVFSFDIKDSKKYGLNFLPIYWCPSESVQKVIYDIFGLASLRYESQDRLIVFENVKRIACDNSISEYIKLLYPTNVNKYIYALKCLAMRILGRRCFSIEELNNNDLFTNNPISPEEFRNLIQRSRTILDTQNPYQDGLTARFMWALGLEKKIITTNESVKYYDFYDEKQVLILKDNYNDILDFIKAPFDMSDSKRKIIANYRIDNWINTLLEG